MLSNRYNILPSYYQSNSISHQRSINQRTELLPIKTSTLLYNNVHLSSSLINNNQQQKNKKNLDQHLPLLIQRRCRPTIETLQQSSDINDIYGYHIQLTLPPLCANQIKFSLHPKLFNENKPRHIPFDPKLSQSFQLWASELKEKEENHQIIQSKQPISRRYSSYHRQTDKNHSNSKQQLLPDLSKSFNNDNTGFTDTWKDSKSNIAVLWNQEESMNTNYNSPVKAYTPQIRIQECNDFESSTFLPDDYSSFANSCTDAFKLKPPKLIKLRRLSYSLSLPTVIEHINDDHFNN
ncbi:unnamed protein product [Adineta steineri]|uniref:Uncharacterized protein n=1 Tax=Adineta steineri TaxID=433720 RepID=A0A815LAL7_9BILA|nr:unnamed protein product [Adineta steineri]